MVEFLPGQAATTLSLVNAGTDPTTVQVRPFAWNQDGGTDNLVPTLDLAVSPPITEIAPGQSQVFRLVLRRRAAGSEASYRLLLDQLPPPASPGLVQVVLRLSLPVFARADLRTGNTLLWRLAAGHDGAMLTVRNPGRQHLRLLSLHVGGGPGREVKLAMGQALYVLPGAERSLPISGAGLRRGAALRLEATTDVGPIETVLTVPEDASGPVAGIHAAGP
jgi:fimbrial chaperone protein